MLHTFHCVLSLAKRASADLLLIIIGVVAVTEAAAMMLEHGCPRSELEPDLSCLMSARAPQQVLFDTWTLIGTVIYSKPRLGGKCTREISSISLIHS